MKNLVKVLLTATLVGTVTLPHIVESKPNSLTPMGGNAFSARAMDDSADQPKIQIAILLDSSNSMDGLIDQTRSQLWEIVNSLADARKDGVVPKLEVALYHYGNDSLPSSEGYLRMLNGFTEDLDLVSEELFGIQTNGGQEYAGWVIDAATRQLDWSSDPDDVKAIFIAGNEPFNQGSMDWQEAIARAVNNDILVNTIYCGSGESEERNLWAMGSTKGNGDHVVINQDQQIAFIPSPYDEEITLLNEQLNTTYIPYGDSGMVGMTRQLSADANSGVNIVTRGASKASEFYTNSTWDLVDAIEDDLVSLEEIELAALPAPMQTMTPEEREIYITERQAERAEIQAKIQQLAEQREAYVAEQKRLESQGGDETLDSAMIQTITEQLDLKGFTLNDSK
ncbi:MAG: VWA domain-containing protein [Synechococcaceae cyanobacterium RL_1_2]|nr:VWA domain-containing protein [Synechococcaceae cyanobacterium RL_1_2]